MKHRLEIKLYDNKLPSEEHLYFYNRGAVAPIKKPFLIRNKTIFNNFQKHPGSMSNNRLASATAGNNSRNIYTNMGGGGNY